MPGSSCATEHVKSLQDRVADQRIIIAAFLGENCLPFILAPQLLEFAKRLSEDKYALDKTTISKTSAKYSSTHGVAESFKSEIKTKLNGEMFSLNTDEATSNNNDKIINVMIQYYDKETSKIELAHLGSRIQNLATAENLLHSLESVMNEYQL